MLLDEFNFINKSFSRFASNSLLFPYPTIIAVPRYICLFDFSLIIFSSELSFFALVINVIFKNINIIIDIEKILFFIAISPNTINGLL